MAKRGRPSKLTKEAVTAICDALSIGSSYELSALYAKISYATLQNWLATGRRLRARLDAGETWKMTANERKYLDFLRQVDEASGEAGITWQEVVMKASRVDPNMALQMLRLRFSGYTERQQTPIAPVDLTNPNLTDDQLQRIAAGEDPAYVLANPGPGGSGNAAAATGDQRPAA